MRAREKSFPNKSAALKHLGTARRKKLQEGYVLRPTPDARPQQLITRVSLPHSQQHDYFDVHRTAARLLVASEQRPSNENAWLHQVDLDAATTVEMFHDDGGGERTQTFSHRALYLGDNTALFAVNDRTWRVDLRTQEAVSIASYQGGEAHFNSHCVWPSRDASYQRALVFDRGNMLRVIDAAGKTVFETCVSSPTSECRSGAISPSGRRVVAYIVSRKLVYGHDDAAMDKTHEARVWDVDSGELIHTVALTVNLDRVGLTPDDRQLVALREYAQGPAFFDLQTGARVHFFDDPDRDDRWATCRAWAYSPDGKLLALGGYQTQIVGASDHQVRFTLSEDDSYGYSEVRHLQFSSDSQTLYVGAGNGEVTGWRLS